MRADLGEERKWAGGYHFTEDIIYQTYTDSLSLLKNLPTGHLGVCCK